MPKENFLLVSLEEEESKKLAEVITNDTSRKLMNYLSEHESATETQIANELKIPLPTVHYNLQKLKDAGLVTVNEFHYSKKGREVDHYKLTNKYVIITTKPVKGIKSALRSILPVTLIIAGISVIIYYTQGIFTASMGIAKESARAIASESLVAQQAVQPNYALWFFIGGISTIIIFTLISLVRRRLK